MHRPLSSFSPLLFRKLSASQNPRREGIQLSGRMPVLLETWATGKKQKPGLEGSGRRLLDGAVKTSLFLKGLQTHPAQRQVNTGLSVQ